MHNVHLWSVVTNLIMQFSTRHNLISKTIVEVTNWLEGVFSGHLLVNTGHHHISSLNRKINSSEWYQLVSWLVLIDIHSILSTLVNVLSHSMYHASDQLIYYEVLSVTDRLIISTYMTLPQKTRQKFLPAKHRCSTSLLFHYFLTNLSEIKHTLLDSSGQKIMK